MRVMLAKPLTNEKKLRVGSISVATAALRFFYWVTLKQN